MDNIDIKQLLDMGLKRPDIVDLIKLPKLYVPEYGVGERRHSKYIDKLLGFRIPKIEQKLLNQYRAYDKTQDDSNKKKHYGGTQTWIGLHPQVLQTPYHEILHFMSLLKKYNPKKFVDIGAGYGRVGVVMNSMFPKASFVGIEIVKERFREANRMFTYLELANCSMVHDNILEDNFKMPNADVYFIYDFSDPLDLKKILKVLSEKLFKERFFIVAKGEGIRSLIQLKFPEFWASHGVIHKEKWSLYSSYCDLI